MRYLCKKVKEHPQPGKTQTEPTRTEVTKYQCTLCDKLYTRMDVLRRHSIAVYEIEKRRFEPITYKRRPHIPITIELPKPWTQPPEGCIRASLAPETITDSTDPLRAVRALRAAWITWEHTGQGPMQDQADDYLQEHAILPSIQHPISYEE